MTSSYMLHSDSYIVALMSSFKSLSADVLKKFKDSNWMDSCVKMPIEKEVP